MGEPLGIRVAEVVRLVDDQDLPVGVAIELIELAEGDELELDPELLGELAPGRQHRGWRDDHGMLSVVLLEVTEQRHGDESLAEADHVREEDPAEGVTTTTGVMYKEFPLNLYGGGTVIMSGIPKYKNNGKKKWLFATAKKKQKKTDENGELCVDEQVDDGPRYIGLYIRNGNLVLTDGEFVLRTKAPPRGQRVLVFAGYYGTRSFVGWWMNPKRYKYNYGELTDRSNDKNGPTLIMLGRGWGTKSPGESAGNGFTIGSIKIVDESSEVGSLGYSYSSGEPSNSPGGTFNDFNDLYNQYKSTLPTKTLDAIAQESAIVAPDIYSKDDMDFYVIDTEKPHDPVLEDMYGSIRSAMEEANSIYQKLQQYPNMPYEEKDKAEKALYAPPAAKS